MSPGPHGLRGHRERGPLGALRDRGTEPPQDAILTIILTIADRAIDAAASPVTKAGR